MKLFLDDSIGAISLGGQKLPRFESMEFTAKGLFEEKQVSGKSGKVRTAKGYADIPITLKFKLLNDHEGQAIDKLKAIKKLFRETDDQMRQISYQLDSPTLNLFEVRSVFIQSIKVAVSSGLTNGFKVDVELIEAENPAAKREKKKLTSQAKTATAPKSFGASLGGLSRVASSQANEQGGTA